MPIKEAGPFPTANLLPKGTCNSGTLMSDQVLRFLKFKYR